MTLEMVFSACYGLMTPVNAAFFIPFMRTFVTCDALVSAFEDYTQKNMTAIFGSQALMSLTEELLKNFAEEGIKNKSASKTDVQIAFLKWYHHHRADKQGEKRDSVFSNPCNHDCICEDCKLKAYSSKGGECLVWHNPFTHNLF